MSKKSKKRNRKPKHKAALNLAPEATEVSGAKLAANRENAQFSTGPTTPEGKAVSSRNALSDGLYDQSEDPVLPWENRERFERLKAAMLERLAPADEEEMLHALNYINATWRLYRIQTLERRYNIEWRDNPDQLSRKLNQLRLGERHLLRVRDDAALQLDRLQEGRRLREGVPDRAQGLDRGSDHQLDQAAEEELDLVDALHLDALLATVDQLSEEDIDILCLGLPTLAARPDGTGQPVGCPNYIVHGEASRPQIRGLGNALQWIDEVSRTALEPIDHAPLVLSARLGHRRRTIVVHHAIERHVVLARVEIEILIFVYEPM